MAGKRSSMAKGKRKHRSGTTVMVLAFMVVFLTAVGINAGMQFKRYRALKAEEARILAAIEDANEETMEIEADRAYYASDAYIEKIAREQLGLLKPNEVLFINRAE